MAKKINQDIYHNFIVENIPSNYKLNDIINIKQDKYILISDNNVLKAKEDLQLEIIKLLKKKKIVFKKNRRKRYRRNIGYNEYSAYIRIKNKI